MRFSFFVFLSLVTALPFSKYPDQLASERICFDSSLRLGILLKAALPVLQRDLFVCE